MDGSFSIELKENGKVCIVFTVRDKCDVDMLTLDMMAYCDDVLYEPRNRNGSYESCLLCSEKIGIKIRTNKIRKGRNETMIFNWMNESTINESKDKYEIMATEKSDFFCNGGEVSEEGITPESLCNAPYYYTEITGDLVMKVKVSHDFVDTYDSASVMVMKDLQNWGKACFEMTDIGTHARS